jgi:N6-adenosine-specific RNA methylase IME4
LAVDWPFGDIPRRSFGVVCADPPWKFKSRTALQSTNWNSRRDVDKHYDTMTNEEIAALPVRELAAKEGCHLFLWSTGPHLPEAINTMRAWGFKFSGVAFTWVKLRRKHDPLQFRMLPTVDGDFHVGLGLTTRKNCEFVIMGRRGNCRRVGKDVRELILAPVREHSRKPDEYRDRVERYVGPGIPIVELFARESRAGWTTWGNEAEKFDAQPGASP